MKKNLVFAALILSGCTKLPDTLVMSDSLNSATGEISQPSTQPTPTPEPTPTPTPAPNTFKASWEKNKAARSAWTTIVRDVVEKKAPALLKGPSDVASFCPMYDRLGTQDRLNFWAEFFSAVAKYESGWSATSRMVETTMGTDPITKHQVASEGLLQLSYQDTQWASYCAFDWATDQQYSDSDARKSIFNPEINLDCGIQILDRQVAKKSNIALSSGVYWAVLKIDGKYTKLKEIRAMTAALSFCQQ